MLKKFWIPVILCVIVILVGCDQSQRLMKPILTPEPVSEPTIEPMPKQGEYPEITYANVLDLAPGRYRMRPAGYSETIEGNDSIIVDMQWGTVDMWGSLYQGVAADAPKVSIHFELTKSPYSQTLDGKRVIEFEPEWDEIVIEIVSRSSVGKETGGSRGNRFEYDQVIYQATLMENLTHPDRKFEYETDEMDVATFNPEPPPKPERPAGIRETDVVVSGDGSFLINNSHLIFSDAETAMQSDLVKGYFKDAEDYIKLVCGKAPNIIVDQPVEEQPADAYKLYFTERQARTDFFFKVFTAYDPEMLGESDDPSNLMMADNSWWNLGDWRVVSAVDKLYYEISFSVNTGHSDCR